MIIARTTASVVVVDAQPPHYKRASGDTASAVGTAGAVDGGTLAVIVDGRRMPNVRLRGVDAPELRDRDKLETGAGTAYAFTHYAIRPGMLDRFNALQAAEHGARWKHAGLYRPSRRIATQLMRAHAVGECRAALHLVGICNTRNAALGFRSAALVVAKRRNAVAASDRRTRA